MREEKTLLFVGRSGNGKSSTANSLIGEHFFGTTKDDLNIYKMTFRNNHSRITVVDGTGIGDTGADMNGGIQDTIQRVEKAVQLCDPGFNALIFVMAYGTRFTKQEKDAVDMIKSLFGRNIFRSFGIIVMSRGDQFEMDSEDDPKTFDQWCKEQTGAIRDLFQECENRIVLFNNRSKDEDTLDKQRHALLSLVDEEVKYSLEDLKRASNDRETLFLAHDFQADEKKNETFLQRIDQSLVDINSLKNNKQILEILARLKCDLDEQIKGTELKFRGTNLMYQLLTPLETRAVNVDSKMRTLDQILHVKGSQQPVKRHMDEENGKTRSRPFQDKSQENQVDSRVKSERNTMFETKDTYINPISKRESKFSVGHNKDNEHPVPEAKSKVSRSLPQTSQDKLKNVGRPQERHQPNTKYFHSTHSRTQHEANRYLESTGGHMSDPKQTSEVHVSDLNSDGRGQAGHQLVVTHQPRSIAPLKLTSNPENNAPKTSTSWCSKGPSCFKPCYEWCSKGPCCGTRCYERCSRGPSCCKPCYEWCSKGPCCGTSC